MKSSEQAPLILLNSQMPKYSETFITNHIRRLHAKTINIRDFLPLSIAKEQLSDASVLDRLRVFLRVRRLHHRLRRHRSAILIEYGTTAAKVLPALRDLNQKIVIHFHGYDAHKQKVVNENRSAYAELFKISSAIVVVSCKMRDTLLAMGVPPHKVHHIVCGVDPAVFPVSDASTSQPVFFSCGRFVEKKAPHLTIMAFHKAWLQNPEIRLRMAGEGPLLETCRDLVKSLGLQSNVQFLGIIDQKSVAEELRSSRAFLQHSVVAADGDSEGTPVGILEAGCCGIPVIASRHAGIADVVVDQMTGLLFDERDVDAMAKAISYLMAHPEQAGILGMQAHAHILEKFSIESSIERLRNLL